jgi:phage FluMu protein Com
MGAGKIIAYISAVILLFFGVLFILATFGPQGQVGNIIIGIILVGIGFGIIFFASRRPAGTTTSTSNVTLNIDLPGNVKMDTIKCKSCGGVLAAENIQMIAGAPVVTCPYCKTTYQLTEEPKW